MAQSFKHQHCEMSSKRLFNLLVFLAASLPPAAASGDIDNFLIAKGYAALADGKSEQAVKIFSQALNINPSNLQARRYLASALVRENKPNEALRQLSYVINSQPGNIADTLILAQAYYAAGNYRQAAQYLKVVLNENPTWDEVRIDLVKAYMNAGMLDEAKQICIESFAKPTGEKTQHVLDGLLAQLFLLTSSKNQVHTAEARRQ
jgi:tetratricopeptide (TPR) repeat protein